MSTLDPAIAEALSRLPDYLGQHVLVSLTALSLGLLASAPLALAALRRPRLAWLLLAVAGIVQTVPGLALLALFYPLLLGLAGVTARLAGVSFSALGFLPAVLALALYSVLPVLRNTLTGISGVDPVLIRAATGLGMTERQILWRVQLPLAWPVIMAGVRTSAVWVIGTATLATPIGQTSLGNYIFTGLQTQNWVFVLFGCLATAVLALVVDQLLALMQRGLGTRRPRLVAAAAVMLALVVAPSLAPLAARTPASFVVGAKPFSEQYILAALIRQKLANAGLAAGQRDGLGSAVIFAALAAGEVDIYVEYTGTIWADVMHRTDVRSRDETLAAVSDWLGQRGIGLVGRLGFENAYALAMTRPRAQALGVASIGDLARHAPGLSIAGDYEFFGRPEWQAVRSAYGLAFRNERTMQPEFMYKAVGHEVDVIAAYTSDGRILANDLVVLADPRHAVPPYDAILLVSPRRAADKAFIAALRPLVGTIDLALIREANLRAEKGETPRDIARWMAERIAR